MNKLKMIKKIMLMSALGLSAASSLWGGWFDGGTTQTTNTRLKETGPVYCRIAESIPESFSPSAQIFTAVDANGGKLNVEGQDVKVVFTNPHYYGGRSNPSVLCDPSNTYKFVGHNPGNSDGVISVKIGGAPSADFLIANPSKAIVPVNGINYEISLSVKAILGNWMLHGDKANLSAVAYLVGVDVKRATAAAAEAVRKQAAEMAAYNAQITKMVNVVKAQQKLAEDALKSVNAAKTSVLAQQFVIKAQTAAIDAKKFALLVSGNTEAEEALKKTEEAATKAKDAIANLKSSEASEVSRIQAATKKANQDAEIAKKVNALKVQLTNAENALKSAQAVKTSVVAQNFANQVDKALTEAVKILVQMPGNLEIETIVKEVQETAQKVADIVSNLKNDEAEKQNAEFTKKKDAEVANKLSAIKVQVINAENALKLATTAKASTIAQKHLIQAQTAVKEAKKVALTLPDNAEAAQSVQKAEEAEQGVADIVTNLRNNETTEAANKQVALEQAKQDAEVAKKLKAVKLQQTSAENALKSAKTQKTSVAAQKFLTQAQKALEEVQKLALTTPGHSEITSILDQVEVAAQEVADIVTNLKNNETTEAARKQVAAEQAKQDAEVAKKLKALKVQLTSAENALKSAKTQKASVAAQKLLTQAQKALEEVQKLALTLPDNAEAAQSVQKAEEAAQEVADIVTNLRNNETAEAARKQDAAEQAKQNAEVAKKLKAVKLQQTSAQNALKSAKTQKTSVAAQKFLTQAQKALEEVQKLALTTPGHSEITSILDQVEVAAQEVADIVTNLKNGEAPKQADEPQKRLVASEVDQLNAAKGDQKSAETTLNSAQAEKTSVLAEEFPLQVQNAVNDVAPISGNTESVETVEKADKAEGSTALQVVASEVDQLNVVKGEQKAVEFTLNSAEARNTSVLAEECPLQVQSAVNDVAPIPGNTEAVKTVEKAEGSTMLALQADASEVDQLNAVTGDQKSAETTLNSAQAEKALVLAEEFPLQVQSAVSVEAQIPGNTESVETLEKAEGSTILALQVFEDSGK